MEGARGARGSGVRRDVTPEPHKNGAASFLRWWPVIVFFIVQTVGASIMYGDIRARLVAIEAAQGTFLTRREADLMKQAGDAVHEELRRNQRPR